YGTSPYQICQFYSTIANLPFRWYFFLVKHCVGVLVRSGEIFPPESPRFLPLRIIFAQQMLDFAWSRINASSFCRKSQISYICRFQQRALFKRWQGGSEAYYFNG
uniref:Uncharacterized protein n=1 Tax=Anopheles atroparvus TaxID=41427 RepID=A0AAG5D0R7_ANOAO